MVTAISARPNRTEYRARPNRTEYRARPNRTGYGARPFHPEAVRVAKTMIPGPEELEGMGGFFKVLGEATRLRILHALLPGELCVRDLSETLGVSVSAVSHQLAVLKSARLVNHRRDGKVIFYSLSDHHVSGVLRSIRRHLAE